MDRALRGISLGKKVSGVWRGNFSKEPARAIFSVLLSVMLLASIVTLPLSPEVAQGDIIDSSLGPIERISIGGGMMIMKPAMTEFDDLSVVLYRGVGVYASFVNDQGSVSSVLLPGFDSLTGYCGQHVLTARDEMWVFYGNGPVKLLHYKFSGSPLPTSAALVSSHTYGDSNSKCPRLIKLDSGALAGFWNQQTSFSATSGAFGFLYRSPSGQLSTIFPYVVSYGTGSTGLALAQHPADKGIWAFSKKDSASYVRVHHLVETSSGLSVDWTEAKFLDRNIDGANATDGEFPQLVAVGDESRNVILLAYQNAEYKIFSTSPFVKGTYVSIAHIKADKTKSFVVFPTYVERTQALALVALPDKLYLGYYPIDQATLSYAHAHVSVYDNDGWSDSVQMGKSSENGITLNSGRGKPQIAVDIYDTNRQVYLYRFDSASGAMTDTTPPVLSLPADIIVEAVGPAGAVVTYSATATDSTDGALEATCTPVSGSTFPIGVTTVSCSSTDISGNTAAGSFLITVRDTTAPSVSLTSPANDETVSGLITVSASASDKVGVAYVDLFMDGTFIARDSSPSYYFGVDTAAYSDGVHSIQVKAVDKYNNAALSQVAKVTVDNSKSSVSSPPIVLITSPSSGSTLRGTVEITVSASDPDGTIAEVELYIDGTLLGSAAGKVTNAYTFSWDTGGVSNGSHSIKAVASDDHGNPSEDSITVKVQNKGGGPRTK